METAQAKRPPRLRTRSESNRLRTSRLLLAGSLVTPIAFGLAAAGLAFFAAFPPVVIGSVVGAVSAGLALSVNRAWTAAAGAIVAGLLFLLAASDPTPGSMTRPSLGLQMTWGHAARFSGLVGVLAGIVEWRSMRGRPLGGMARSAPVAAAVAFGLIVGIGATTTAALKDPGLQSGTTVVAVEPDATLRIVERDNVFVPVVGGVAPGQLVRVVVENQDEQIHSFTTTNGPRVDADTLGHKTTTILVRAPETPGAWSFYCKYHPGMDGTIPVEEAGSS